MERKENILIIIIALLFSSCTNEVVEKVVKKTDTIERDRVERIYDTTYLFSTDVKTVTDSVIIFDTLPQQDAFQSDTLLLESNLAIAQAWVDKDLKGTIKDKDTILSFYQDSSRRIITETMKTMSEVKETKTRIVEEKYVPWWIYLLWGVSLGVVLVLRFKI